MGSKRLDRQAATRLGEPVLVGLTVRPHKSRLDIAAGLAGALPVVGDAAQAIGEAVEQPEGKPHGQQRYRRLNIKLYPLMYLTLTASKLAVFPVKGLARSMLGAGGALVDPVFSVSRADVTDVIIKFNARALFMSLWSTPGNRWTYLGIQLMPGASVEVEPGAMRLSSPAILELDTDLFGGRGGIKKIQTLLRERGGGHDA